jgi:hypothetical protein
MPAALPAARTSIPAMPMRVITRQTSVVGVIGGGEPGVVHPGPPDPEEHEEVAAERVPVPLREPVVQLRRRAGDRHHEGEVEEELQRRARAVRLARVTPAERARPRRRVPGRHARRVCRPARETATALVASPNVAHTYANPAAPPSSSQSICPTHLDQRFQIRSGTSGRNNGNVLQSAPTKHCPTPQTASPLPDAVSP